MAQAIICDVCQTAAADFLLTNLDNGETFAACGVDFFVWCGQMAEAVQARQVAPGEETPLADETKSEGEADADASANGHPKSEGDSPPDEKESAEPAANASAGTAND